jgi:hypothetical protein
MVYLVCVIGKFEITVIFVGKSVITWHWAGKLISAGDVKVEILCKY